KPKCPGHCSRAFFPYVHGLLELSDIIKTEFLYASLSKNLEQFGTMRENIYFGERVVLYE
ncbi:MAG: hypothetical protein WAY25_09665, partial [Trichococcus flocculiformis]